MGRNEALTCELHELVKVLDAEDGLPELPEVELEHPGHGVDVVAVRHVRQGVLAPLKTLPEIVYLRLKMEKFRTLCAGLSLKYNKRGDVMGDSGGNQIDIGVGISC